MSSSVHPWLRAFAYADCLQGNKTNGTNAPFRVGKKVQVVKVSQPPKGSLVDVTDEADRQSIRKFLTFRPLDDAFAPLDVWAQVSDPEHFIACRFLASSVTAFRRSVPPFADLTSLKGSILLIKAARAVVWPDRVPAQVQNSPWAHIRPETAPGGAVILEVVEWKVLGCTGEAPFWENAQEVASLDRRRLVKIQRPDRDQQNDPGGCDSDDDSAASAMQGRVLREWIMNSASHRMRRLNLEGNTA